MRVSFPNDGKPQGSPEGVLLCSGTSRLFIHIIASPAKALAALECPSLPGPMIAHRATAQVSQGTPLFPSISFWSPCRSEEHTSELQSLMRISYAVFCLKKNTLSIPSTLNLFHIFT